MTDETRRRLTELEEICGRRPLTLAELDEIRALTEGADVLPAFEALLSTASLDTDQESEQKEREES